MQIQALIIVCILFLLLPFILGYVHTSATHRVPKVLLYYRYFMLFNMIFAGLIVALRILFTGPKAALDTGWSYSPMYQLYGVAILSMVVMGIVTTFSRTILAIAPAILWFTFLFLATILNIEEITHHIIQNVATMTIHIGYNMLVCIILGLFFFKLKKIL